jgi:hypothetical protein
VVSRLQRRRVVENLDITESSEQIVDLYDAKSLTIK